MIEPVVTQPVSTEVVEPKRRGRRISDSMRLTAFTIGPGARWDITCTAIGLPQRWIELLRDAWAAQSYVSKGYNLPTRRLGQLLIGIDPAVIHVGSDLASASFITTFDGPDLDVITAALASWATTEVSVPGCRTDWFAIFTPDQLIVDRHHQVNLFEHTVRANGTAAPAQHMYDLLPTFLAQAVTTTGLTLLGKPRSFILGPPQVDNGRAAVLWPPIVLHDDRNGDGFVTAKVQFHIQTVPNRPDLHIRGDLSTSRFPAMPVSYVPARGGTAATATVWLHAPTGFLRRHEPHTLLAASAIQRWNPETRSKRWEWSPGLATALARLTHLRFPDPNAVFADPAHAAGNGPIRAYVLYSEGTKSRSADDINDATFLDDEAATDHTQPDAEIDADAATADLPRAKRSFTHVAATGLVPADHIEIDNQLAALFREHGIQRAADCVRVGSKQFRKIVPATSPDDEYTLEVWTEPGSPTRQAILTTLTDEFGLHAITDGQDPDVIRFAGDFQLRVILRTSGAITAGIERVPNEKRPQSTVVQQHANELLRQLSASPDTRCSIVELDGANYFSRAKLLDPKPALKLAFARSGRPLQCIRPARLFTPPKSWPENSRRPYPTPYPGTALDRGSIYRAKAAIADALRQHGRIGAYALPGPIPAIEQVGIWMYYIGTNTCIPIVIRLADGTATAYLASAHEHATGMPYHELPKALADGKGRIKGGKSQKAALAAFLINVLGLDANGRSRDTHDRVVFVRALNATAWGWHWLYDKNIRLDELIIPGVELGDDIPPPAGLTPDQCPGLRIIRVRERSAGLEVPRGFAPDPTSSPVRVNGLFRYAGRVYYSINPRSDQMQARLDTTKLDVDKHRNYQVQVSNPVPLEIFPAFLQVDDRPDDYAVLTSSLRRTWLHTGQDTRYPTVLHLCSLAKEYIAT